MSLDLFKLEKLTVEAYSDRKRSNFVDKFEAMFNPTSFNRKYAITYAKNQGINTSGKEVYYSFSEPSDLSIKLLLDGAGAHQMAILNIGAPTVSDQITKFMNLTYHMNGEIHEPHFLIIKWGDLNFSCRLGSVNISYNSFDRDGKPLRAELDINVISDQEVEKRLAQENKGSPDLTHSRIVKHGDTLPLLSKAIYGSSAYYLWLAQQNGLDDFRKLTPGQRIHFPPLPTAPLTH